MNVSKNSLFLRWCLPILLIMLFSCEKTNQQGKNNSKKDSITNENIITNKDIENIKYSEYVFSDTATPIIADWVNFIEIEAYIELLKNGDLSFLKDEDYNTTMKRLFAELKNEIPLSLNTPPILVRLNALETMFFKLEDNLKYNIPKEKILDNIKDLLVNRSNLILQINKKLERDSQNIVKPF